MVRELVPCHDKIIHVTRKETPSIHDERFRSHTLKMTHRGNVEDDMHRKMVLTPYWWFMM